MSPAAPHWIAVTAASALGIGLLASGAISVANAMPLVNSTTTAEVPPISTQPEAGKGGIDSIDVTFPVPSSTTVPTSSPSPSASPTLDRAPVPQPVAPRPAATADDSVASPLSPASIDD